MLNGMDKNVKLSNSEANAIPTNGWMGFPESIEKIYKRQGFMKRSVRMPFLGLHVAMLVSYLRGERLKALPKG